MGISKIHVDLPERKQVRQIHCRSSDNLIKLLWKEDFQRKKKISADLFNFVHPQKNNMNAVNTRETDWVHFKINLDEQRKIY